MRTLFSATCFLFIFSIGLNAQTANSGDCRTAIPVCADGEPIMPFVDGSGDIDEFDADVIRQTGCLEKGSVASANIENNTSWFVFRAGTDGQIGFDIEALSATAEWDFALYGPFDQTDGQNYCTIIGDGTAQPIRCNYEVNNTDFTGIGINPDNGQVGAPFVKGSQNTYDEWLDVVAGELYYLFINNYNTNFDGDPEPFSLTFTGTSVDADQDTALDCTLRDEFLGLDIIACEGDPDIVLSAQNSPAGAAATRYTWVYDEDDDPQTTNQIVQTGPNPEYVVTSPNSGRYNVSIDTNTGMIISDDGGILIIFYPPPELDEVLIVEDLRDNPDVNLYDIEIVTLTNGDYEYAINGGDFQDEAIFLDVPPGLNTVVINDKNGCGMVEEQFLVVGYPKFFTPNGDGIYDNWQIEGISELTNPDIFIFDRYGELLKQIDETSPGWDGTFNGRQLPSSDYWFKLEYDRDDQGLVVASTTRKHFTLLR